jgi:hypothetical protein
MTTHQRTSRSGRAVYANRAAVWAATPDRQI